MVVRTVREVRNRRLELFWAVFAASAALTAGAKLLGGHAGELFWGGDGRRDEMERRAMVV